ncbi:MAG: hypothetical protein EBR82_15340 [Caulobacteraceae bacterium]|nr:hypothetical protein [Caulobacteraceae bacterium]
MSTPSSLPSGPAAHHATTRLGAMTNPSAVSLIQARTRRGWIREACEAWESGLPGVTVARLGVYAMADERGNAVPTLLISLERVARGPSLPARAAVLGIYSRGELLEVTDWATTPGVVPAVGAERLAP